MDYQLLITVVAVIGAAVALYKYFAQLVRFMDRQEKQDKEIKEINAEQGIIVEGLLACLKGLSEQGCNGPVTAGIEKLEKHLNAKAHEVDFR